MRGCDTSKAATLRRVIRNGLKSRSGEPGLTHCGRFCDLMSPRGLAYLILGIGTVESFNALLRQAEGPGEASELWKILRTP